jgi:uncharacterized protein
MSDAKTFPTGIAASDTPDVRASTASQEAGPVRAQERIQLLDVLRGFALLGMMQVNHQNAPGDVLSNLITFLAAGSFYTTFAFLFGLGFAMQLLRAEEAKRPFIVRYLWRTVILLFIGVVHLAFFRANTILVTYALFAGVLLLVRRWRPSLILALAAAWLVLSMSPVFPEGHVWTRINPEQVEAERLGTQLSTATAQANPPAWCKIPGLTDAYRTEVCRNAVAVRTLLTERVATVRWWQRGDYTEALCMFLLGLYAGRRRILRDAAQHTRFLAWVAGVGLVVGLAGNALDVFGEFFAGKGIALPKALNDWHLAYSIGNVGLSLFYLSSVTLLFTHWRLARRVLAPLAPVGRMVLTNFFMQPFIFMTVLGYRGFDILGGVEAWHYTFLINSFFVVQILYSRWWFQHFQIGPMEWAWRSLTWFRVQPMRIARAGGEIPPA